MDITDADGMYLCLQDLNIALNYGHAAGSVQLLRFVTEHTEVTIPPANPLPEQTYSPADRAQPPLPRLGMYPNLGQHLRPRHGLPHARHTRRVHHVGRKHLRDRRRNRRAHGRQSNRHQDGQARPPPLQHGPYPQQLERGRTRRQETLALIHRPKRPQSHRRDTGPRPPRTDLRHRPETRRLHHRRRTLLLPADAAVHGSQCARRPAAIFARRIHPRSHPLAIEHRRRRTRHAHGLVFESDCARGARRVDHGVGADDRAVATAYRSLDAASQRDFADCAV